MREKFQLLMKNEGLTQSKLAEILEIQPGGISHILAGRNKPGFDLLQKILRRFPRLNPDWLLLDSENMYRDTPSEKPTAPTNTENVRTTEKPMPNFDNLFSGTPDRTEPIPDVNGALLSGSPFPAGVMEKEIARVIVLYSDRTFESFTPQK